METSEGLPSLSRDCWIDASAEMDIPWQFGPESPFGIDSQYVNIEGTLVPGLEDARIFKNCEKSFDSEFGWQWILDHQQTYKGEWFSSNEPDDSEMLDDTGNATCEERCLKEETDLCSATSSLFSRSKIEGSLDAGTSNASKLSENLFVEPNMSISSYRDGFLWRTADAKELAALVSQKGHGYLANCDLPPSQNSVTRKGPVTSFDVISSNDKKSGTFSANNTFLASPLCSKKPTGLGNRPSPASGSIQLDELLPSISETLPVPSAVLESSETQPMTCKVYGGTHAGVTKQGFEALGEALCLSQTRARRAEKLAAQALQEREKFVRLLFRESWTSRTYKQWVRTLELENMRLKMCSGSDDEVWMSEELSKISEGKCLKHCGKHTSRKKTHRHVASRWEGKLHKYSSFPESSAWLHCTIGLAFALGLSLTGTGLIIGWSMGWILLSQ